MQKTGPNPLSPYKYDVKGTPVDTLEMMLYETVGASATGTEYDKSQTSEIRKNQKDIQSVNQKVKALENSSKNFCTKSEMNSAVQAAVAGKADKSEIPSLTGYCTKEEVDQILTGYYSQEEVNQLLAGYYPQEQVNQLLTAKETEIYNLTKLVGEIGGNVTYNYPNELGTSLTSLMNNSGTVKLTEDATITRFGPGVTAKNNVKINLNGHNITSTSAGSYGAIQARGMQTITIGGNGTIDAAGGICIEANGASCTINLTGSTTNYHNSRSGGELIYCYLGTINISGGVFKNDGENNTYTLNCYDANYKNGTAKIVVTGGKFYNFNPANNAAEGPNTSFVPEGYTVVESMDGENTVYTVKKA